MAEPVIVSWTPANWITVVLMVGVAFVIVAAVSTPFARLRIAPSTSTDAAAVDAYVYRGGTEPPRVVRAALTPWP